jgi:PAS domain-containing protein
MRSTSDTENDLIHRCNRQSIDCGLVAGRLSRRQASSLFSSVLDPFLCSSGAALLANRDAIPSGDSATLAPASQHGDEPLVLQSVIDALPDPVIAVTWKGEVAALNSQVRKIAPSLRTDEPLSLGLRRPALIAAVRRASATGHPQRVEFSERARADHWYEVAIIPAALSGSSSGEPTHLLLTFHDLTAHRRIEQMRADFVANASMSSARRWRHCRALSIRCVDRRRTMRRRASASSALCRAKRTAWHA